MLRPEYLAMMSERSIMPTLVGLLLLGTYSLPAQTSARSLYPGALNPQEAPMTSETRVWLVRACVYHYLNGWEIGYRKFCLDDNDLIMPFMSGRYAMTRQQWQGWGISHSNALLKGGGSLIGRQNVRSFSIALWAVAGGKGDQYLTDIYFE
jgi:hypothetical protein